MESLDFAFDITALILLGCACLFVPDMLIRNAVVGWLAIMRHDDMKVTLTVAQLEDYAANTAKLAIHKTGKVLDNDLQIVLERGVAKEAVTKLLSKMAGQQ